VDPKDLEDNLDLAIQLLICTKVKLGLISESPVLKVYPGVVDVEKNGVTFPNSPTIKAGEGFNVSMTTTDGVVTGGELTTKPVEMEMYRGGFREADDRDINDPSRHGD
jgi:hypothetical protein